MKRRENKALPTVLVLLCLCALLFGCKTKKSETADKTETPSALPTTETAAETASGTKSEAPSGEEEHRHIFTDKVIPPTCTAEGYTLRTCACGESYRDNKVAPLVHDLLFVDGVAPTCQSGGLSSGYICAVCGYEAHPQTELPPDPLLHNFEGGVCTLCGAEPSKGLSFKLNFEGDAYALIGPGECRDSVVLVPPTHEGIPVRTVESWSGSQDAVVLPEGVRTIEKNAFMNARVGQIVLPQSLVSLGVSAFAYSNIERISLPQRLRTIPDGCFEHCSDLAAVDLPSGLMTIGKDAFLECSALAELHLPQTPEFIGEDALRGCDSLCTLTVVEGNPSYISRGNCIIEKNSGVLVFGCAGSVIPNDGSVTSIGQGAFYDCRGLREIALPSSVTTVGKNAFRGCEWLESLTFEKGLVSLGDFAFSGCKRLENVVLPEGLTTVSNAAFYDCSRLIFAEFPESVTTIGNSVFTDCRSLTSFVFPSDFTYIPNNTFVNCVSLASVTVGGGITEIRREAFTNCVSLSEIRYGAKEILFEAVTVKDTFLQQALEDGSVTIVGTDTAL